MTTASETNSKISFEAILIQKTISDGPLSVVVRWLHENTYSLRPDRWALFARPQIRFPTGHLFRSSHVLVCHLWSDRRP